MANYMGSKKNKKATKKSVVSKTYTTYFGFSVENNYGESFFSFDDEYSSLETAKQSSNFVIPVKLPITFKKQCKVTATVEIKD